MKRLYLIGGPMGVGKTTVCQELKRLTAPSVFLDGDWCWDMEPFQVTAETKAMVQENIAFLLGQFLRCSAYETVIFCWVMHQREIIQELLARLPLEGVEVLTFLPGQVPPDLGFFTQAQCCQAVERMKAFHSCLRDFPGCPPGWTVCHNDLSPCNYVFQDDRPVGIIDWDAAAFGHPLDDLAYALWLWLDLGNEEYSYATVRQRMGVMLDAYGVAQSVFPTPQQTAATSQWARRSQAWLRGFWNSLYPGRL